MRRHDMTYEESQMVLDSHTFFKQKRDSKIKGWKVAGGKKQRKYIPKEDDSSPTVIPEPVLLTSIADAKENRGVAVIDTPNTFI